MIDLEKLIHDLNNIAGCNDRRISDARKVCMMWRSLRVKGIKRYYGSGLSLDELVKEIEDGHFPLVITQTVTIEIQRKSESLLEDTVDQLRIVPGVKEVKTHDKC